MKTLYATVLMALCLRFPIHLMAQALPFSDQPVAQLGTGPVYRVSYSANGGLLLVGGNNGTGLYDAQTLTEVGIFQDAAHIVNTPDGKLFAYVRRSQYVEENVIRLWDTAQRKEVGTLLGQAGAISSLALSPDGKTLASGSGEYTVWIWDLASRQPIDKIAGYDEPVRLLAFTPDGKTLISGTGSAIYPWDIAQGKTPGALQHPYNVEWMVVSPNSKMLAVGGFMGHPVELWDLIQRKVIATVVDKSFPDMIESVVFSPDSRKLVLEYYDTNDSSIKKGWVNVYNIEQRDWRSISGHTGLVLSVAFSPDGKLLASASTDKTIRLWDANLDPLSILQGHNRPVTAVAFSPDSKRIVSGGSDNTTRVWDANQLQMVASIDGHKGFNYENLSFDTELLGQKGVTSVVFGSDNKTVATGGGDGSVRLWDATTGKNTKTFDESDVRSVALSPDNKLLVSGGYYLDVWDIAQSKKVSGFSMSSVYAVAFSPDGKLLASASGGLFGSKTISLWNVSGRTRAASLAGHASGGYDAVNAVAFSSDSKLLASGGSDKTIRLWDTARGSQLGVMNSTGQVYAVAFSPDGKILVSGGDDRVARIWDVAQRKQTAIFSGLRGTVRSAAFSPDGKFLALGVDNETVRLWNVALGSEVEVLWHDSGSASVAFSPDGKLLASADADGTVLVWGTLPTTTTTPPPLPPPPVGKPSADFNGSGHVDFDDFFLFAAAFGQPATGDNAKFDLDKDGTVGFGDFFIFAEAFGKPAGKPMAAAKPVVATPSDLLSFHAIAVKTPLLLPAIEFFLPRNLYPGFYAQLEDSRPQQFELSQNYPNPFNSQTAINYALPEPAQVKLVIYGLTGQVVRTLVAAKQPAGRYQTNWNATDERGSPVATGIYIYRLNAGSFFTETRRMLLVK